MAKKELYFSHITIIETRFMYLDGTPSSHLFAKMTYKFFSGTNNFFQMSAYAHSCYNIDDNTSILSAAVFFFC